MTDHIFGALVHDWERAASHLHHHGPNLAETTPPPQGETMSLSADLRALADKVEPIADETIGHVQALAGNPETATLISDAATLVGLSLPATVIANATAPLRALLTAYAQPGPQMAQQPPAADA